MKRVFGVLILFASFALLSDAPPSSAQSPAQREMEARARIQAEQERRNREREELKAAAEELAQLTEVMMEEVAAADGYTTSAKLVEATAKIEEVAKKIEALARTVQRRAQGR